MENQGFLWLLPALPFLGSVLAGALHFATLRARRTNPEATGPAPLAGLVAVAAMAGAFAVAVTAFLKLKGLDVHGRALGLESGAWDWIDLGSMEVALSMVVDPLSAVMILVITGVGLLIHLYSTGYMKGVPGYAKNFA